MTRSIWSQVAMPVVYLVIGTAIAVFIHSAVNGNHGLGASRAAQKEHAALDAELADLRATRAALENRVRRLSDRHLDLDLLDERARAVLGLVRPDEIVVR